MNDGLFALSVTGTLSPDPVHLRMWYVGMSTELQPQIITHDV